MRQVADFLGFSTDAAVVVTGAASGIGRETAIQLLGQGLRVIGFDIDAAGLANLNFNDRFAGRVLDVSDQGAIDRAFKSIHREFGPLHHLVNNAGPPSSLALSLDEGMALTAGSVQAVTAAWEAVGPAHGASSVTGGLAGGRIALWPPPAMVVGRA